MKNGFLLTALCLLLAGCSTKLVYSNLDWLIPMYVDDYVTLDDDQDDILKTRLPPQLKWHCRVQLPRYVDLLEDVRRDFESPARPLTSDRLREYISRVEEFWLELRIQLGPDVADILASATDGQIDELYDAIDKQHRKRERKYRGIPEDDALRLREKRMTKRLEYWLSELTGEQQQAVAEWSRRIDPIAEDWLDDRKRVQADFRRLLEQRNTSDRFKPDFANLLLTFDRTRAPEYQAKLEANASRTLALIVRLNRMLTPEQRAHLLDRIETLSRSLEQLACDQKISS